MSKYTKLSPLGLSVILLFSCGKENARETQESSGMDTKTVTLRAAGQTSIRDKENTVDKGASLIIGLNENIAEIVASEGLSGLSTIEGQFVGEERDAAMTLAIDMLASSHSKSDLLDALRAIHPGSAKQKWIWSAVSRGQGVFDVDFFSSIENLDYLEERSTAIQAFASQGEVVDGASFEAYISFLDRNRDLDAQFIQSMKSKLIGSYSLSLHELGPKLASDRLREIPDELRGQATEDLAGAFVNDGVGSAMDFAGTIVSDPNLASTAYSVIFEHIGETDPIEFETFLSEVPSEYKHSAINSFVSGWLWQDSVAASQWLLSQSDETQSIGAEQLIRFLEHKKASDDEIQPWRDLLKSNN